MFESKEEVVKKFSFEWNTLEGKINQIIEKLDFYTIKYQINQIRLYNFNFFDEFYMFYYF
jgi:hypothetical protein